MDPATGVVKVDRFTAVDDFGTIINPMIVEGQVHGDTGRVPFGMGTYGSRSISVGGAAIMKALDKIETKAKKIAAHLM